MIWQQHRWPAGAQSETQIEEEKKLKSLLRKLVFIFQARGQAVIEIDGWVLILHKLLLIFTSSIHRSHREWLKMERNIK